MTLRVVSYGGGVQSTALLVLAAQGKIDFKTFLFSNVGDDSEHPATLAYVRDIAMPYAADHDIELHEVRRIRRDGRNETLYQEIMREGSRSIPIPMRLSNGAPGNRACTVDYKISVLDRWLKQHGATADHAAVMALGISTDELHRAKTDDPRRAFLRKVYPLLDLRMNRADCQQVIAAAGIPIPPKSSCWFCPFHRITEWQRMKREEPDLFDKAVEIERTMQARLAVLGKDAIWMTDKKQLLDQVIGDQSIFDFDSEDTCESGYCMT